MCCLMQIWLTSDGFGYIKCSDWDQCSVSEDIKKQSFDCLHKGEHCGRHRSKD